MTPPDPEGMNDEQLEYLMWLEAQLQTVCEMSQLVMAELADLAEKLGPDKDILEAMQAIKDRFDEHSRLFETGGSKLDVEDHGEAGE
jgi:hypothetical protein